MKITAKRSAKRGGGEVSVEVELPSTLQELVDRYSEEIVYSHAKGSLVVALQGFMRGQLDRGKSESEITQAVQDWKPGQRKPGKSPAEKARENIAKLSPEDRAALLKEFRAQKAAA